jgi:hypothetical protein
MQLDPQLRRRLALLERSGQVDGDIVEFLAEALPELAADVGVPPSEEALAMLATHSAVALQRVRQGEALREWEGAGAEEVAGEPELLAAAAGFAARAYGVLGLEVPEQERLFVAMHLGAARLKA